MPEFCTIQSFIFHFFYWLSYKSTPTIFMLKNIRKLSTYTRVYRNCFLFSFKLRQENQYQTNVLRFLNIFETCYHNLSYVKLLLIFKHILCLNVLRTLYFFICYSLCSTSVSLLQFLHLTFSQIYLILKYTENLFINLSCFYLIFK